MVQRQPPFGDGRSDRRDRHTGRPPRDEDREDHAERLTAVVGGAAGEQEPEAAADTLYAGRDARVARLEGEAVGTLGTLHAKVPGQRQEVTRVAVGCDASPDAPRSLRGQHRG